MSAHFYLLPLKILVPIYANKRASDELRGSWHSEFKLPGSQGRGVFIDEVFHLSETSSFILQNDKNEIFDYLKQWAQEVSIFTQIDEDPLPPLRHQIASVAHSLWGS